MRTAYGVNGIAFDGISGDGSGQTIGIVETGDNPGFVDTGDPTFASSDLGVFDTTFGLPDPPSFEKVSVDGSTDPSTFPPVIETSLGESSLDVEWAHAIAPAASIVVIEAGSADLTSAIECAGLYLPSVSVVSSSYGIDSSSNDFPDIANGGQSIFAVPPTHQPITFLNDTGDNGAGRASGFSPNALAVGGTTLTTESDGTYVSESGWFQGGGGISTAVALPAYQTVVSQGPAYQAAAAGIASAGRAVPDVSLDADPYTGVAVYDSTNNAAVGGWYNGPVGGTSLSTPLWA